MTHVDQLIAVAEQVTTGRTSAALDRLAAIGALSPPERAQLAADDTIWSLERLLRTAELSGHDPDRVLADAVATRDFEGAHSVAQEIHHRITHAPEGPLTPPLTSATDLIPRDAPEDYWGGWRTGRCRDTRRHDLGARWRSSRPHGRSTRSAPCRRTWSSGRSGSTGQTRVRRLGCSLPVVSTRGVSGSWRGDDHGSASVTRPSSGSRSVPCRFRRVGRRRRAKSRRGAAARTEGQTRDGSAAVPRGCFWRTRASSPRSRLRSGTARPAPGSASAWARVTTTWA